MAETGSRRAAAEACRAAQAYLANLDDDGRRAATAPFDQARLGDWHYVPRCRPGLPLGRMGEADAGRLWRLLATVLGAAGLKRAEEILRLEAILGDITRNPGLRDPGNYALLVLGDPGGADPFAFRFEGHHLSLTVTVVPGEGLAVTPTFYGANPARVPDGHGDAGFRLFAAEEDRAFALIGALEGDVLSRVLIGDRSLGDIVAGPGRERMLTRFEGIEVAALPEGARDAVLEIAARFPATMAEPIARHALDRLRADAADSLHFAWAGSLERGHPHYFRIHGARTLIEYDNTQDGANHVHTVWIDPVDLFGADLLARHHSHDHG